MANTVSFSQGLDKMSQLSLSTSKSITKSLGTINTAATAMAASVVASFAAMTNHAQDFSFEMAKFAEKTGTSTEMFSKLAYSAREAGVPIDMLKGAMERLARTAGNAQNGQKEAITDYKALGISAKDLTGPLRNSGDLLIAVSKKLETLKDSTAKTNLEQKLLGRTGSELAPMLRQLGEGFEEASARATLFGVVIGEKAGADARKLHESLVQLESVALGFSLRLLSGVSPALQEVSQQVLRVVTSVNGMKAIDSMASSLATVVRGLGNGFEFAAEHATAFTTVLSGAVALQGARVFVPLIMSASKGAKSLDDIGLIALGMAGKFTGLTQAGTLFKGVGSSALSAGRNLRDIVSIEKAMEQNTNSATVALNGLKGALGGVLAKNWVTILAAGLGALAYGLKGYSSAVLANEVDGGKWVDLWSASLLRVERQFGNLRKIVALLTGDIGGFASMKWDTKSFNDSVQEAGRKRRGVSDDTYRMIHAGDIEKNALKPEVEKKDAPHTPKETTEKVDIVQRKLLELSDAAEAAQNALRDAGKGVDFERADQITKEYTKTIDELNLKLATQGKSLSAAQIEAIKVTTATRINDEAGAQYAQSIFKTTEQLIAQTAATQSLTNMMGASAAAKREAQASAEIDLKYAGQSAIFRQNNAAAILAEKDALIQKANAENAKDDRASLINIQEEINAQMRLTSTILENKDARDAANLANEQAAITKSFSDRGDTDKGALDEALAKNAELYSIKQKQADLNKAASMNPAMTFLEEASALTKAADAAREAGSAIGLMQMKAANKANWDQYVSAIDKVTLSVGSAQDGVSVFFDQMAREAASSAQQVHDVLSSTFQSLNGMLERLIQGQRVNFSDFFRGISEQVGSIALQKGEQALAGGLMKSLGIGTKADPTVSKLTETNATLSRILDAINSKQGNVGDAQNLSTGAGKMLAGLPTPGVSGLGSSLTSFMNLLPGGGIVSSLFGGHRALGGDVTAGMSYDVGEMGREKFTPSVNGKITRNDGGGNGTAYYAIDARGANEEAVNQRVKTSLGAVHESAVRTSINQVQEGVRRRPKSARF